MTLRIAIALVTLAACDLGRAQPADPLALRIEAVLAKAPSAQVGVLVAELPSGRTRFERHPDLPLKPASVLKLLTTAAAIQHLGPDFSYQTELYLSGDELWVRGAGDPGLGDPRLEERGGPALERLFDDWAQAIAGRGATSISRIVIDDSIFDTVHRHPDWPAAQADRWYQAPVGGVNINDNCLDVAWSLRGESVALRLRPPPPDDFYRNRLRPGAKTSARVQRPADSDVFEFTGTVSGGGSLQPAAVGDPTVFFGHVLRHALQQRGIDAGGPVVRRRLTAEAIAGATLIAIHRTALEDVLWRCNAFSQNLFAECLIKSLAAYGAGGQRGDTPGSWDVGVRVVVREMERLGVDPRGASIRDGSGLSHENRLTARQVVAVLAAMARGPDARPFLDSLAQPGQPGTMRSQFADRRLLGRMRGKTGTIQGVKALAGCIDTADGGMLAFALLVNGAAPDALPLELCRLLADAGPPP